MGSVHLVNDPRQAAMLAAPLRQRILEALAEPGSASTRSRVVPGSASTMARTLGLPRQKVAYHVRQLEEHGFVELVREEKRRGCTERIVRRKAQYLVASPNVLAPGLDPKKLKDKFSSSYLIALASRMAQEVGEAQAMAEKAGKPLPTLSTDVEIRLRSAGGLSIHAGWPSGNAVAGLRVRFARLWRRKLCATAYRPLRRRSAHQPPAGNPLGSRVPSPWRDSPSP